MSLLNAKWQNSGKTDREKDLGFLVDSICSNQCQAAATKAKKLMVCIKRDIDVVDAS